MENGQAQMLEASKEKQPHVIVPVDNNNDEKTDTVIGHSPSSGKSAGSSASSSWVLSWEDLSYSVAIKKENKSKVLIGGMSGSIKSGEVVAIMGGSGKTLKIVYLSVAVSVYIPSLYLTIFSRPSFTGAGKSTLLNCLAGRIGPGNLGGKILLNGKEREAGTWTKLCAYVEQDDVMFTNISVYDTLSYSALLRLPASLQRSEKLKRVNDIIMQLGLDNCRNTWIGDSMNRGISGGERKRVSIGIEMVTNPQVFFLDEPTSGLDAFNAFNIIQTIKQVAKAQGKVVLMTIHQPRTDILEMFDKIILLSAGKEVFSGTLDNAITHFDKLGYTLPPVRYESGADLTDFPWFEKPKHSNLSYHIENKSIRLLSRHFHNGSEDSRAPGSFHCPYSKVS